MLTSISDRALFSFLSLYRRTALRSLTTLFFFFFFLACPVLSDKNTSENIQDRQNCLIWFGVSFAPGSLLSNLILQLCEYIWDPHKATTCLSTVSTYCRLENKATKNTWQFTLCKANHFNTLYTELHIPWSPVLDFMGQWFHRASLA